MGWLKNLAAKMIGKRIAKNLELTEGKMEDGKKWYKSRGVQGGIVGTLLGAYALAQVFLGPQLGVNLPDVPEFVIRLLEGILGVGGGALAIYGRIKAQEKVTM